MAARQEPDEPSFCLEVKTKHLREGFGFSKICPKEFMERNSEKFGLSKKDITLTSNEHDGIFLDGLQDFVDFHQIQVHDRITFKVDSKIKSHLHVCIRRSAVPPVVAKIEVTTAPTQCTAAMAAATSAVPSRALVPPAPIPRAPMLRAAPGPAPRAPTPRAPMPRADILRAPILRAPILRAPMAPAAMAPAPILRTPMPRARMAPAPMPRALMFTRAPMPRVPMPPWPHGPILRAPIPRADIPRADILRAPILRAPILRSPILRAPMAPAAVAAASILSLTVPRAPMPRAPIPRARMPRAPMAGAPPMARARMPPAPATVAPVPMPRDPIAPAPMASAPMPRTPMAPAPMAPALIGPASIPRATVPLAPMPPAPLAPALITAAAPTSPTSMVTSPGSPSVIKPPEPSTSSASTNMKNAARSHAEKRSKGRLPNKQAPRPRPRSPDRTRLGAGVLQKVNYCEDVPTKRPVHNKRQHVDAEDDADDPPEVQAHKKRVRAGYTLEQHLESLPQASEGGACDASAVCGSAPISIIISKTPTGSLAINYWVDMTFAMKWRELLKVCHDKDILLSNQRGRKWRVHWNYEAKEVDHTTTGWSSFVADHNLHDGDRCDLMVLHTEPIELGFSFIRKPGSKSSGCGIARLLKDKPKEMVALEGLERGYGSEGDAIALDSRQPQYRSHFRFQPPLSDDGKFFYSSDCPGTYARITPYPKRSRRGKKFHPYKKSQPGTSFEPGIATMEYITEEFLKATSSKSDAEDMSQHARGKQPGSSKM